MSVLFFLRLLPVVIFLFGLMMLSSGAGAGLHAAQLVLPNGDRLNGEMVAQINDTIYFNSNTLGLIVVPAAGASVIESDPPSPPAEALAGLPPNSEESEETDEDAPDEQEFQGLGRATPPWEGTLELGFLHQSGRESRMDLSLRGSAERKINRDQIRATARILYSRLDDLTSSNRYDGSLRWRRDLSTGIFGQSLSSYTSNRLKRINHSFEQNVGLGYRLFDHDRHIVNIGLGLTGRYRDELNADANTVALGEFFEDYTYRINGRFTFTQNALTQISSSNSGASGAHDYKFEFNAALQGKVTERISMNLRFEYEFDKSISNPGSRTDQRVTSTLGYAF